ncbi:hypothetical protein [Clostridium algidicarnis]|uniref:hypothetical protein n=1 Tax=Clostridium algidicarnis TaxID=37659 RepID=UPI0004979791|nr:hypothetical protein [Clostridium algidicarnis]
MYWLKQSIKLFFYAEKKEICSFFFGVLVLLVGFRLNAPKLEAEYTIIILTIVTMACRYNFVADYIAKSDMDNLCKKGKVVSYIVSKNVFSITLTFSIVFISSVIYFFIRKTNLAVDYYITLLNLGVCTVALNNLILIFHNKPSELRSNDYKMVKNVELGFKDLLESLPSLIIVFLIYYFNKYCYNVYIYQGIVIWILSIIMLDIKLKSLINI